MTEDRAISFYAVEKIADREALNKVGAFDHNNILYEMHKEEMAMQYQRGYIDGFHDGKATFEPKTGHWIDLMEDNEMSDDDMWRYSCIKCHSQNFRKTLFCPNCGADMRGDDNADNS